MLSLGIWMVPETPAPVSTLIPVNCMIIVRLSKILCERLFERFTQTVTQTGIGAGSRQRNQRSGQQIILSQQGRKGQDSSFFPPSTHLHTQEVTGSSPVVSTRKFLISCEIRNFSLYFIKIIRSYFFVFLLTQTVTHKRKRAERMRQHQVGFSLPGADFCGFFVFFGYTSFG